MSERVVLAFGAFRLDLEEKVLYRDGEPVPLTLKALDTLAVLVERHPRLVTKDELFARVWPDTVVEDNNLAQHISLLRKVLADGVSETPIIETVPRRGYRFCPPVTVVGDTAEPPAAASVVPGPALEAGIPSQSLVMADAPAFAPAFAPALRPRRERRLLVGAAAAAVVLAAAVAGSGLRRGEPDTRGTVDPTASIDGEARLLYLSGRAAFSQGYSDTANQARARADLERAVARDPQFAPAWARLAMAYTAQYRSAADGRRSTLEAADRAAEAASRLAPDLPESRLARADVLYTRGEIAPARQALEASRDLLAGDAAYWHLLGLVEQRQGRWRASEAAFARAFDIDGPGTAEWLAIHFLHLRQYADARRVLSVATASSRTAAVVPDAWTRFSEGGDVAAARGVLERALQARTTPDARVRSLLAQLEWFDGRVERALELIGAMDASGAWLAPNFRYPATVAAGDVLATAGRGAEARTRYAEALVELERLRHTAPDDTKLMAALGLAYAGLGRAAEAVTHAERAVALMPRTRSASDAPLYLYLLARVRARLGHHDEAFAVLDTMFDAPGFYSEAWVQRDPTFAGLRADPAFAAHLARWVPRKGEVLLAATEAATVQ